MVVGNLTDYQQEQLTRFLEVCTIDDERAVTFLRQTNWSVNVALEMAFSQDLSESQSIQQRAVAEEKRDLVEAAEEISGERAPLQGGNLEGDREADNSWMYYIVTSLRSLTSYVISFVPKFLLNFLPRWLLEYKGILPVANQSVTVTSPLQQFREEYGPLLPNFTDTPLSALMGQVTRNPLFLYFHSRSTGVTDTFCARTLGNQDVINYLDANFVSWFGSKASLKDWRLATQMLNVSSYPYICVLSPRQGRPDATRFNIAYQHAGAIDALTLISALKNVQENFQMEVARSVAHDMQLQDDRELRVQQEADYKRMIDEEKRRIDAKKAEAEELARVSQEELKTAPPKIKKDLPSVPEEPDENEPGVVRARIRLPDGSSKIRRFLDSNSVEDVFNYVMCCEPKDVEDEKILTEYTLVSSFPRLSLSRKNASQTLKSLGLTNSMNLFVQP